jgi:phage tail sheath gpL-like
VSGGTANDRFVSLYTRDTTSKTFDANRIFWGDIAVAGAKTQEGYVSISVNGTTYWTPIYSGGSTATCSTNLSGSLQTTGTFTQEGYALVKVNNSDLRWLLLYSRVP